MPFIENEGVKLYYELEGEGYPLFIHHGLGGHPDSWREAGYVKELSENNMLILLQARGHGLSDKPHNSDAYLMKKLVSDVTALLDHLNIEKAHFHGYSLGGIVGLSICKYSPERFSALIIGGMGVRETNDQKTIEMRKPGIELWEKGVDAVIAMVEENRGDKLPQKEIEYFKAFDPEAILAQYRVQEYVGYREFLPKNHIPTLLYCGDKDSYYESAVECAEIMRNSKLVTLPDLDHGGGFDKKFTIFARAS
jgi:pimeloyl-ACP methyl ester carboxylesterase